MLAQDDDFNKGIYTWANKTSTDMYNASDISLSTMPATDSWLKSTHFLTNRFLSTQTMTPVNVTHANGVDFDLGDFDVNPFIEIILGLGVVIEAFIFLPEMRKVVENMILGCILVSWRAGPEKNARTRKE